MPKIKPVNTDDVIFTHVRTSVVDRGLVFYGYKSPEKARRDALNHYRKELEKVQALIELLETNKTCRVNYTKAGKYISQGDAMLVAAPSGVNPDAAAVIADANAGK